MPFSIGDTITLSNTRYKVLEYVKGRFLSVHWHEGPSFALAYKLQELNTENIIVLDEDSMLMKNAYKN